MCLSFSLSGWGSKERGLDSQHWIYFLSPGLGTACVQLAASPAWEVSSYCKARPGGAGSAGGAFLEGIVLV